MHACMAYLLGSKNTKKCAYHGRVEHMREVEIPAKKKPCVSFFF